MKSMKALIGSVVVLGIFACGPEDRPPSSSEQTAAICGVPADAGTAHTFALACAKVPCNSYYFKVQAKATNRGKDTPPSTTNQDSAKANALASLTAACKQVSGPSGACAADPSSLAAVYFNLPDMYYHCDGKYPIDDGRCM